MFNALIRPVRTRSPITVTRTPWLARLYRFAFQYRASRTRELFLHVPVQKLFRLYHRLTNFPHHGEFAYARLTATRTVRFNARNLQYQALYGRVYERGYEQETASLLDIFLQNGGTFFDVGSNWGFFALYTASVHPQVIVHAFEPHPNTFQDLSSCVSQAGLKDVVTCHNIALSNRDSESFIRFPDGLHSGSAEVADKPVGPRIHTRRLDGLKLPAPDVIKMDVEGHELEALEGAAATLQSSGPFLLFENKRDYRNPDQTLAPLLFLASLGYQLFIPALQRRTKAANYFVPCGPQADLGAVQVIEPEDCLALIPFSARDRFLYQHDLNVFACHPKRQDVLLAEFKKDPACPD